MYRGDSEPSLSVPGEKKSLTCSPFVGVRLFEHETPDTTVEQNTTAWPGQPGLYHAAVPVAAALEAIWPTGVGKLEYKETLTTLRIVSSYIQNVSK